MIRRAFITAFLLLLAVRPSGAAENPPSAELRRVLEGTWTLVEWPAEGTVMRPPEAGGRWMVRDGIVLAVRFRNGPKSFESSADYGEYKFTDTEWSYGYERNQLAQGPSAAEAKTTIQLTQPIKMRTYKITHEGAKVILRATDNASRWEFDGPFFSVIAADGTLTRKYRKISQ